MARTSKLLTAAALVAIAVSALGACGSRQPGVGSTASDTPPPSSTAPESPAPETPEPTEFALTYTCGGHPFSPTLFNEPEVDLRTTPAGVALAEFIESGQGGEEILPADGFRLAGKDDTSATFVAPMPGDPPYADAQLEKNADGWRVVGWGQCRPEIEVEGVNSATWVLAPDETINPGTQTFQADVTERECASGASSEGRVREPLIIYEPDRVIVIFTVDRLPGDIFNCQGNPSTRVQVELSEPLGDRQLLDGGLYPWQDPTKREPWQR